MPLGYIPGSYPGFRSLLSHRIFGSRKFSRAIEYRLIRGWLPDRSMQVLDLGAGGGEFAIQLALLGHRVVALDLDTHVLREARSPYVQGVELVTADATCLPFKDGSFDLVVCNSALEHFPNDEEAISEMARVARVNGVMLVTTDCFPSRVSGWLKVIPRSWRNKEIESSGDLLLGMQAYHRKKHHVVNYYLAEQLVGKFQRNGLRVQEWRYYLNDAISKGIYELHILLRCLGFYNKLSRRLFPLFYPFTFPRRSQHRGYGLALKAVKSSSE